MWRSNFREPASCNSNLVECINSFPFPLDSWAYPSYQVGTPQIFIHDLRFNKMEQICYLTTFELFRDFLGGSAGKESCLQWGRPGFDPWVGKIPWRRETLPIPVFWPGEFHGLYSPWGRRAGHDWVTFTFTFHTCSKHVLDSVGKEAACKAGGSGDIGSIPGVRKIPWRRKWQPTPVFLPGESHGQRSMAGYLSIALDTTEWLNTNKQTHFPTQVTMAQTSITEVPCGVMCEWRAAVMALWFSCFKDLKANEWERVAKGSTDTKLASRWCLKAGSGRLASFGMNSSNLQAPGQSLLQTVNCSARCPGGHQASLNTFLQLFLRGVYSIYVCQSSLLKSANWRKYT